MGWGGTFSLRRAVRSRRGLCLVCCGVAVAAAAAAAADAAAVVDLTGPA